MKCRVTTMLVVLIFFFVVNVLPWTFRLTRRGGSGANRNAVRLPMLTRSGGATGLDVSGMKKPLPDLVLVSRDTEQSHTLAEMIAAVNYSKHRTPKACEQLADNVTIDLSDPFRIGVVMEVLGRQNTTIAAGGRAPGPNISNPPQSSVVRQGKPYAYVLMVSNHKYIDGAIVVADSLAEYSEYVRSNQCDLVLLVPEKINRDVLLQLSFVFHRVKIVRSMDVFSDKSYYKTTFDKMYLYYLQEYESIIFFDADSLITANPDKLFQKVSTQHPLTAVGGGDYFQTALLILKPNWHIFLDLYLEYRYGSFGYNQWRARDGILFRNCLMSMHDNIGHPTNSVFHFYGFIKPWFNKDAVYKHAKDKQEFEAHYKVWWERYERLHTTYFAPLAAANIAADPNYKYGETALNSKKNGKFLPLGIKSFDEAKRVDPFHYMWIQRFSGGSEYLRPTFRKYAELRNIPSLKDQDISIVVAKKEKLSCDAVCSDQGSACVADALQHSALNDCQYVYRGTIGGQRCTTCTSVFDNPAAPFVKGGVWSDNAAGGSAKTKVVAGVECFSNFLHEPTAMPLCNATAPGIGRRICACRSTLMQKTGIT